MKKVVFIVTSLNSGGIENYLLRFLNFFDGSIHPIIICKSNFFGDLEENYSKITHIELIKMNLGNFNFISYFKLYSFLKKNKVDTVCDFTGNFAGLTMLTANYAAVNNRISFYRGSTNRFKETPLRLVYNKIMQRLVASNATKILSNSKAALDFFYPNRDPKDSKFEVIYNGIDARRFNSKLSLLKKEDFGIPSDSFVIGHTGRYDVAKNHVTILKVAQKICRKYDTIYFILCGKNTDVFLKQEISEDIDLRNKVKLLGFRSDVSDVLSLFDLYFFPSITEGQPNALIEAMISGLPIVASNINPIIETTPDILHKELVHPLDVIGFCDTIEKYYLNREEIKTNNFSEWAIHQFNPEILFGQFYKEL